ALAALGERRAEYDLTEAPRVLVEALGESADDLAGALEHIRAIEPRLATMVEPTLGVTMVPTIISASEKINVIPARAELRVDCRVPPEMGGEAAMVRIREVLGDAADGLEVEFVEQTVGNRSPVASPLMDAIAAWLGEHDAAAETVPTVLPAFTDSRWWRHAFPDCVAYGFFPHRHTPLYETWPLIHSADERIDVRDLGFATQFFFDLPGRMLT
ncbi:MAG TPA: peptidase dimerization domain-containing protein, partial [Solirubrobacteraceae bacterium]